MSRSAFVMAVALAMLTINVRAIERAQVNMAVRFFVLDMAGDGIQLTSAREGVDFDVDSTGSPVRTAWTAKGSDDGFILVDEVPSGTPRGDQLLGTGLRLPDGRRLVNPDRAVLAIQGFQLDKDFRIMGRTGAVVVTFGPEDAAYKKVRLWVDANHNGRSEPEELRSLEAADIRRINSAFRVQRQVDEHGNVWGPRGNYATSVRGIEVWRDAWVVQFAR